MGDLVLTTAKLDAIRAQLENNLISAGIHSVLIVDSAGNIIASCGEHMQGIDSISLAALTAANFAATSQIARIIGEEDFSLLFHKGKKDSIHFAKIGQDYILISIFNDNVSLGVVRLKVTEVSQHLHELLN
ncbi:MAG: roadblock/LC7 domain-containing protein [Deltaproteobacteria bacterium]|nr:roadblock/LC7 domain-containing protein [Deltaproteobacteria bacterium]